jgi:adenylate cyclase, class 2
MKREIEVKVKIESFDEVLGKLKELGCEFSEPVRQEDTIFINYDRPFIEFTTHDPFLRIRKTKGKTIFTFKQGEEMNSVEREFEVSDAEQLEDTLKFLGFRPEVKVSKVRQKSRYKDYEICLDQVESLGSYIELEKITEEEADMVQAEMMQFLESLDIKSKDRVLNGYDTLVWLKNNPSYQR